MNNDQIRGDDSDTINLINLIGLRLTDIKTNI